MLLKAKLQALQSQLIATRAQYINAQRTMQHKGRVITDMEDMIERTKLQIDKEAREQKAVEDAIRERNGLEVQELIRKVSLYENNKRADCEHIVDNDRQRRWRLKAQKQQAEILLTQLNKTMGLYKKPYEKLSKEGLQMLRNWRLLSTPLDRDLESINDEIPF